MLRSSAFLWIFVLGLAGLVAWQGATIDPALVAERSHYGFLSLVPALATLAICFATRNVILALFLGIVLGGLITTDYNIIQAFLIPSVGSERYAQILLVYLWALGGLLGMWNRNGGAWHFAQWISQKFVRSRRSALFFAWLMGIIFHQGGTISTVLTGTTVRPVADREKVAHEELAYVVDSTAAPISVIIPPSKELKASGISNREGGRWVRRQISNVTGSIKAVTPTLFMKADSRPPTAPMSAICAPSAREASISVRVIRNTAPDRTSPAETTSTSATISTAPRCCELRRFFE